MKSVFSNSVLWIAVALVLGAVLGYSLKGGGSTSKPESQQPEVTKEATQTGTEKKDTKEWKIQNAMSAAPDSISKEATVFDWPEKEGSALVTLQKGTNEWSCLPDYPASPGNDPICADKQGMSWFEAYMSQKPPQLSQAGIGYMLQGGSDASNTDPFATKPAEGEDWVSAPPHVMVFPAGKLDQKVYGTDYKTGKPWIMFAGTPYEHLMVPVK